MNTLLFILHSVVCIFNAYFFFTTKNILTPFNGIAALISLGVVFWVIKESV